MSVSEVSCAYCEQGLLRPTKEVNRSKRLGRRTFCSEQHSALYYAPLRPIGLSETQTRVRARKIWIERHNGEPPVCWCGIPADVYHEDGNPLNNTPENHVPLCRSHHVALENKRFPKRKKVHTSTFI